MKSPLNTVVITYISSLGKKRCWVHDGKNVYIEAEVKESGDDGKVLVETRDGEVKKALVLVGLSVLLSSPFTKSIDKRV